MMKNGIDFFYFEIPLELLLPRNTETEYFQNKQF